MQSQQSFIPVCLIMIQTKLKCQTVINLNCVNFQSILSLVLITLAKFSCYKEDDGCVEKLSAAPQPQLPVSILRMLLAVVFQQLLCCLSPNLNCIQRWMKSYFVICTHCVLHNSFIIQSALARVHLKLNSQTNIHGIVIITVLIHYWIKVRICSHSPTKTMRYGGLS